jgi:hypothetical protein
VISPPAINVAAPPIAPPEFFFLGTQGHRVAYLHKSLTDASRPTSLPPLAPFVEAVFYSTDRVWILDAFFDEQHGLPALFAEDAILESKAEFRIISRQAVPTAWLGEQRDWAAISPRLLWRQRDYAWFHGRFAIVDGNLWHFGSTVGGAYPGLDAASRWYDPVLVGAFQHRFEDTWGEDKP